MSADLVDCPCVRRHVMNSSPLTWCLICSNKRDCITTLIPQAMSVEIALSTLKDLVNVGLAGSSQHRRHRLLKIRTNHGLSQPWNELLDCLSYYDRLHGLSMTPAAGGYYGWFA